MCFFQRDHFVLFFIKNAPPRYTHRLLGNFIYVYLKGRTSCNLEGNGEVVFTLYSLNINQQTFLHRLST